MGKLKNINWKGIIAGVLSAAATFTLAGCSEAKEGPIVVNNIGYSNVRTIDEMGLDENRFAVLDAGDHDTVKIPFQRTKFEMCNEHGVCLGIVISSDSSTESDIYDDVEYAKSLVRDYEVKFPVYFNIDKIITNDNLNIEMKTKLIKDFLEKCSANNIYVALHGTDTNLCLVKEYCKITGYDALVVKDKEEITYDGKYNVYEDLDGTLYATVDLEQIILGKGLNDSKSFANDGSYTISSEDELREISLRCGMSVNEILEFNNLKKKDIVKGTVLRIPCQIDTSVPQGERTFAKVDEPLVGCDMSYAQGKSTNWGQMSNYFDFVILRSNTGLTEDDCFSYNAQQAAMENIPIGAYCFNEYNSKGFTSLEDFTKKQEQQADFTISVLKNKKIDYPVYLDIEGLVDSTTYSKEAVKSMLNVWAKKMTSAGYIPGIYCNGSTYQFLSGCVDYDISDNFEVWVAGGPQYSGTEGNCSKHQHVYLDDISEVTEEQKNKTNATIYQRTNIGVVRDENGDVVAGDSRDHLDINLGFIDYAAREEAEQANRFAIKEFDRVDWAGIGINAASAMASLVLLAGGSILGVREIKKKLNNKSKPKVKMKK